MLRSTLKFLPSIRLILVLSFLLRLGIFVVILCRPNDLMIFYAKDTATYLVPAQELLISGTFAANHHPEIIRTPGYSVFLIIGLFTHHPELMTITLQIILSVISCYLIFLTGKMITNEVSARWGALLFSFEPLSLTYTYYLLSETLFIFLLLLAVYQFVMFLQSLHYLSLLISITALAATVYVRPIAYYLTILWIILLFSKRKNYFLSGTIFLVLTILLLGVWHLRNTNQANYKGFSAVSDVMLYFYHASAIESRQTGLPLRQIIEDKGYYNLKTYYQIHPEQQNWTESQRYTFWRHEGLAVISKAPMLFAGIYGKGLGVTLLDPGSADFLRLLNLYTNTGKFTDYIKNEGLVKVIITNKFLLFISIIFFTYLIGIYSFAWAGFRNLLKENKFSGILLLLTCCYLFLLSGGVIAIARLRAPIMPLLVIIAGHGIAFACNKLTSTASR